MIQEAGLGTDIGRALDEGPWTSFQKSILILASMAFIVDGLANQVLTISIPALIREWHLPRAAFSSVTALGLVGVTVGTLLGGMLSDRIGRKTILVLSIVVFGIATLSISFVTNIETLKLMRLVDGLGIGGAVPTGTTLIAEFTPTFRRSRAVNIAMISIPLGTFLCGLIGGAVLPVYGWQKLFLINGSLAITLAIILFLVLPESPRYLVRRPHRRKEFIKLLDRLGVPVSADAPLYDSVQPRGRGPLTALFGREILSSTLGLWGAFFFSFLAIYTAINWIPTLLSSRGFPLDVTSYSLTAYSIGGMAGSLVGARFIELFGSRFALCLLSGTGAFGAVGLSMLPLNPADSIWPIMVSLALEGLCLSGLTGCLYGLAAYIYPPAVKSTGLGSAGSVGRIGAILSSYTAIIAMSFGGGQSFFLFVAASMAVAFGFLLSIGKHIPKDKAMLLGPAIHETVQ